MATASVTPRKRCGTVIPHRDFSGRPLPCPDFRGVSDDFPLRVPAHTRALTRPLMRDGLGGALSPQAVPSLLTSLCRDCAPQTTRSLTLARFRGLLPPYPRHRGRCPRTPAIRGRCPPEPPANNTNTTKQGRRGGCVLLTSPARVGSRARATLTGRAQPFRRRWLATLAAPAPPASATPPQVARYARSLGGAAPVPPHRGAGLPPVTPRCCASCVPLRARLRPRATRAAE